MAAAVRELLDAVGTLLADHERALATCERARMGEATDGLLRALGEELPARLEVVRVAEPPRHAAREAMAARVVAKRLAECEGLLLQLRLRVAEPPAGLESALRLAALLAALERALHALRTTLDLWAACWEPQPVTEPPPQRAFEAARAALRAGVAQACTPLLRRALLAGLARPLVGDEPAPERIEDALALWDAAGVAPRVAPEEWRRLDSQLAEGVDLLGAWALLDEVERAVGTVAMTSVEPAERARALAFATSLHHARRDP